MSAVPPDRIVLQKRINGVLHTLTLGIDDSGNAYIEGDSELPSNRTASTTPLLLKHSGTTILTTSSDGTFSGTNSSGASLGDTLTSLGAITYPPAANSFVVGDGSDWKAQTLAATRSTLGITSPWVIHSMFKKYKIVTNATSTTYDENANLLDQDASDFSSTSSRGNYIRGALTSPIVDQNSRSTNDGWGVIYSHSSSTLSYAVTIDLESSLTIERVALGGAFDSAFNVLRPSGVKLEHSSDDSSWTTLVDKTGLTQAASGVGFWRAMFTITATTDRYWRITLTCAATKFTGINDIQLWGQSEEMTLPMDL